MLTNISLVTITGSADWYASSVEIMVVGYPTVHKVPVVDGHFSKVVSMPQEGKNQLLVTSFDPFEGTDTKLVSVRVDTIAPEIWLKDLEEDVVNYVNNPSLVVVGTTDDPTALITVNRQEVGLLMDNTFATTYHLGEGPQVVRVEARDAAGNLNRVDLMVTLDTVLPGLTLVDPPSNPFWSNKETVTVQLEVGEIVVESTLNGDDVPVVDGLISQRVTLGDGRTQVDVVVVDRAGNVATMTLFLFLDDEMPALSILQPRDGAIVNTTAVPILVVTTEVGCTLSAPGTVIDATEVSNGRLVGTMYLTPGEGLRETTVVITDRAGNTRTKVLTLDVDTVKPFISLVDFSQGKKVTTEPIRLKGYTEAGAKVVRVNGRLATLSPDGEFTTTLRLEEGDSSITVEVVDRANNHKQETFEVKVLGVPDFQVPVAGWAAITITFAMGALVTTTEIGRYTALVLFLPLYTKLRKEKILDQRTRGLIQGYITANPGCNYTIIRDNLDLADGTLTYHLQVLEREGFVYSIREGLFRCFYPQGVPPPKRGKLHLSDTQADIVRIVKRIPGITVGEIATAMKRRPNVISYHLKLLKEGGLVRMEEDGRHVRVYPVDSAVAMI
jgi:predicted transcriptional regulator